MNPGHLLQVFTIKDILWLKGWVCILCFYFLVHLLNFGSSAEYLSVRVYPTNMFPVLDSDRIPKEIDLICFGYQGPLSGCPVPVQLYWELGSISSSKPDWFPAGVKLTSVQKFYFPAQLKGGVPPLPWPRVSVCWWCGSSDLFERSPPARTAVSSWAWSDGNDSG